MTLNSSQVDRLVQDLLDEKDKLPRTDLQVDIFNATIQPLNIHNIGCNWPLGVISKEQ